MENDDQNGMIDGFLMKTIKENIEKKKRIMNLFKYLNLDNILVRMIL